MMYKFTVFTPTFNRRYTLERVFKSLLAQTLPHDAFEWIIIDDGSTDNTAALVHSFIATADFPIRYIYQSNQGKHSCHNTAINMAAGELFLILDSDDALTPDAMDTFWKVWQDLPSEQKTQLYGIHCLCQNGETGSVIGSPLPCGFFSDAYRWKQSNRINFDTWSALNTAVFKHYLFPEIAGIHFIPESYVWDIAGKGRPIYAINIPLKTVYYQADGFSRNIIESYQKHAKGRFLYHQMAVNNLFFELLRYNPLRLIKDFIQLGRMGFHGGYSMKKTLSALNTIPKKLVYILALPASFYLYRKDLHAH